MMRLLFTFFFVLVVLAHAQTPVRKQIKDLTAVTSAQATDIFHIQRFNGSAWEDFQITWPNLFKSPPMVTPNIGAATATSVNGLTLTTSTGTVTIGNGKTLTVSNTITLAGNDGSTLNIGAGGTLGGAAFMSLNASGFNGNLATTDDTLQEVAQKLDDLASAVGSQTGTHATPTTANPLAPAWEGAMHTVYYGATGEIDLPAAANYAGRGILIYNTGAFTITIDPNGLEVIVRNGNVQAGGVSFTLSSGAGNFVALLSDGARWITLGFSGTLTVGS